MIYNENEIILTKEDREKLKQQLERTRKVGWCATINYKDVERAVMRLTRKDIEYRKESGL